MLRNRAKNTFRHSALKKVAPKMGLSKEGRGGASDGRTVWSDQLHGYFKHHRQVFFSTLQRLIKEPAQTLMTSLVVAIALGLPALLYVGVVNLQQLGSRVESTSQLTLFLHQGASEQAAQQLEQQLVAETDIASVEYISRQQALDEFRALSGFGDVLEMLDENPLPPVLIAQPADQFQGDLMASEALVSRLKAMPLVDDVRLDMKWMQRLQSILAIGERLAISLAIALALGVLLIIGNTIRLAIENRRDEIVVVKLVGGTNAYVRRPFLYTGIWYGATGGLLAWLLVTLGVIWVSGPVERLAELYQSVFELRGLGASGFLSLVIIGIFLGLIGAWLAVAKHLASIEPK